MKINEKFNQIEETVCLIDPERIENNNAYIVFEVVGNSMQCETNKSISRGSKLYTKRLKRNSYSEIEINKNYLFWVIETSESKLPILKEIIGYNEKDNKILISSLNKNYPDTEISLSNVVDIFYVVFKMQNVTNISCEPFDIEVRKDVII